MSPLLLFQKKREKHGQKAIPNSPLTTQPKPNLKTNGLIQNLVNESCPAVANPSLLLAIN